MPRLPTACRGDGCRYRLAAEDEHPHDHTAHRMPSPHLPGPRPRRDHGCTAGHAPAGAHPIPPTPEHEPTPCTPTPSPNSSPPPAAPSSTTLLPSSTPRLAAHLQREVVRWRAPDDPRQRRLRVQRSSREFHPDAVEAGLKAILAGATPIVADVEMICVGLSKSRLSTPSACTPRVHFRPRRHRGRARRRHHARAVQAMKKAYRLGLLFDGAIVGIGNAPTALDRARAYDPRGRRCTAPVIWHACRLLCQRPNPRPLLGGVGAVPWITIRGPQGRLHLVVAALHALLGLAGDPSAPILQG